MTWIPIGAWIAAAVVAIVVLGFCAYEIGWKSARLRRDVAALQSLSQQLGELGDRLAHTRDRIAAAGRR